MAHIAREEFSDYESHWRKENDLEKPLISDENGHDCYGLDADAQAVLKDNEVARKQLITASVLCFMFLIAELIGGYMANSLAIMTDAAHLLSDIAGFMISLASMYLATQGASRTMSFGYARAEILGSLMSVMLIWLMTGIIVYEAIQRLYEPQEVKGQLMFWVAFGGLIVNFSMGMVLMQAGHSHSHGGLPGTDTCGGHGGHGSHGGHGGHGHEHHEAPDVIVRKPSFPSRGGLIESPIVSPLSSPSPTHSHESGHGHAHGGHGGDGCHDDSGHGHSHGGHGHAHGGHGDSPSEHGVDEPARKKHKNINVHAAFIHVVGDAIQSVGVMFAAALIWYNPAWRLADPICSFIFAVLVLLTTSRLVWQASHILMEGIPEDINPSAVREDLAAIPGVLEVHDLHIWSISVGKPALCVHLLVDDRACKVLKAATAICNSKHHINHTTIQVETEQDGMAKCRT